MSKTLDIIIPHHREPWGICRKFFDMLKLQLRADLSEIRVMMIHDGSGPFSGMDKGNQRRIRGWRSCSNWLKTGERS